MESSSGKSDFMTCRVVVITGPHLRGTAPGLHSFPHPPTGTRRSSKSLFFSYSYLSFSFLKAS